MKKILSLIFVILWMILIFMLSNIPGKESHNISVSGIDSIISHVSGNSNNLELSEVLNYPIRKILHFSEYLILCFLLYNCFYQYGLRNNRLYLYSIFICILYSISDEFHQMFLSRTPSFSDVILDTFGGVICILNIYIINLLKR